ncbi:gamma-glutamyl-gamma-aminobutyrate hydrolase family protein [Limibacillus sp. MBR-115]|jgi:putative glutamine amidotransferase|uniref:gamma-glutamyl-gamma-aminobutyrate hydrolase family protein n=1 Tax=Limibacillus sp. MBR-115 TaxID=3156465 RepID=UPI003390A6ED
MTRRPIIGVTTSRRGGRFMWWFNRFSIWRNGGRGLRITADKRVSIEDLDGLIVGGGDDIVPSLYGGALDPAVRLDPERDQLELDLLRAAEDSGLPILGICRGAQMINVARGGNLHGDIKLVYDDTGRRRTPLPLLTIDIAPDSRLAAILRVTRCRVNALHRQAVDRLGHGLAIVAHDQKGVVQALEGRGQAFLFGVQWHPEFLIFNPGQQRLYRRLIRAARSYTAERVNLGLP